MPVGAGRRPFLDYVLSTLADAGASRGRAGDRARARGTPAPLRQLTRRRDEAGVDFASRSSRRHRDAVLAARPGRPAIRSWSSTATTSIRCRRCAISPGSTPGAAGVRARRARASRATSRQSGSPPSRLLDVDADGWLRAHRREARRAGDRRSRPARAGQHELLAVRRAHLRRPAATSGRSAAANSSCPKRWRSPSRGVCAFRAVPARGPSSICPGATDVADVAGRLAGIEPRP